MEMNKRLSDWSEQKTPWFLLFATSLALEIAALIFQHAFNFAPCVMCIYQRTAVWGIVAAGAIVLLLNNIIGRLIGYAVWAISAVWGALLAYEHMGILGNANPLFSACDAFPQFPTFMPLHEWLPSVFAATGFCEDDSWQFLGLNMPQWMFAIFIAYSLVCFAVLLNRLVIAKRP